MLINVVILYMRVPVFSPPPPPDLSAPGRSLQLLMLMLPPSHRVSLQHLLELLAQVARHHHETKMDAHNLALVFAPTLFLGSRTVRLAPHSRQTIGGSFIYSCAL